MVKTTSRLHTIITLGVVHCLPSGYICIRRSANGATAKIIVWVRFRVRNRVRVSWVRLFSPLRHLRCAEYRKPCHLGLIQFAVPYSITRSLQCIIHYTYTGWSRGCVTVDVYIIATDAPYVKHRIISGSSA